LRDQRLDPAFEILTRDEINGIDAIRKEAEQQAPVDSDSMAQRWGRL